MIHKMMESPVMLALFAALMYGFGAPLMKQAAVLGATPSGLAVMYGVGAFIAAINWGGSTNLFATPQSAILALTMGLMFGFAFRAIGRAFELPGGSISIVMILVASYPLISSVCGLAFFDEASKTILPRLALGSLFVIAGAYLVGTSAK